MFKKISATVRAINMAETIDLGQYLKAIADANEADSNAEKARRRAGTMEDQMLAALHGKTLRFVYVDAGGKEKSFETKVYADPKGKDDPEIMSSPCLTGSNGYRPLELQSFTMGGNGNLPSTHPFLTALADVPGEGPYHPITRYSRIEIVP